ncbi:MAG: ATP-binding protein, partial [Opitutales bacterium]
MQSKQQLFGRLLALDRLQEEVFNEINPNFSPVVLVHGISGVGKTALCEHFLTLIRQQLIGVDDVIIIPFKGVPQSSSTFAFSRLLLESIKRSRPQPRNRARSYDSTQSRELSLYDGITNPNASERY